MKNKQFVVCYLCFDDNRLREWIRDHNTKADCPWCKAKDTYVIPIIELGPILRDVAAIYDSVYGPNAYKEGEHIDTLLQEDWGIFSEKIIEYDLLRELTIAILKSGISPKDDVDFPDYEDFFQRKIFWLEDELDEWIWDLLVEKSNTNSEYINFALEDIRTDYQIGQFLYRARIHEKRLKKERFSPLEVCAPPPEKAGEGRANRKGEPVLYLSSNKETALSEVRPWNGSSVAIATMKIQRHIEILNLSHLELLESPFFEEYLEWKLQVYALFYRFSEDLSRPVLPNETKQLYLPTQHLCDLISSAGYDGIAYPSGMSSGYNVVLFNPNDAKVIDIEYVRIQSVRYESEIIDEQEPIYDEMPYDYLLSEK